MKGEVPQLLLQVGHLGLQLALTLLCSCRELAVRLLVAQQLRIQLRAKLILRAPRLVPCRQREVKKGEVVHGSAWALGNAPLCELARAVRRKR